MQQLHLIILLYDSVTNSVFESQVLTPYQQAVQSGIYATMTLITYEKQGFIQTAAYQKLQEQLRAYNPAITCHVIERPVFLGIFSLWPLLAPLRTLLEQQHKHVLVARGPISGYLARYAANTTTAHIILQARGLLHAEYCMTTQHAPWWLKPVHAYRAYQYKKVEQHAYTTKTSILPTTLETVSPALKAHIAATYKPAVPITLATHDTPPHVPEAERLAQRTYYRKLLGIATHTPVYAYNGSLKTWQCPDMTFRFFKEQLTHNNTSVLLFISQDKHAAQQLGATYQLPRDAVIYIHVPHKEVVPLLCAADYGLLFREQHIVNWTSRPTKLLEYQSAGLQVIHNNSIEILQQDPHHFYANPNVIDFKEKE